MTETPRSPAAGGTPPDSPEQHLKAIEACLDNQDVAGAETLNRQLNTLHPMAVAEVVKAAELIDAAKSAAMDSAHLDLWSGLYDTLSEDEQRCLYFSLREVTIPPKKVILHKGAVNSTLYFLESGTVAILHPKGGNKAEKAELITRLTRGKLLGEYTFATIALCSATAVSMETVRMRCLDSDATLSWQDQHPGLHDKLIEFCMRHGSVQEILHRKKTLNRTSTRHRVAGRVDAEVLEGKGAKTGTRFRGEVVDISASGVNFTITCSQKATARELLTRSLALYFTFTGEKPITMRIGGQVVGVSYLLYNDYSLHVRFGKRLPDSFLQRIEALSGGAS